jgi:hypothetical protein
VRANDERDNQMQQPEHQSHASQANQAAPAPGKEPYLPPVIEQFPPMGNVTFGTNIQPTSAMALAGA